MKYQIVSDSSSNVLAMEGIGYCSVPLKIRTAVEEFVDDSALDVRQMVDRIRATKGRSGTACPGIGEWLQSFGDADCVFAVTITSNLSGSYQAAVQAAEDYEAANPGKRVHIVDSLSAGPELRLILEKLQELAAKGLPFEEIRDQIEVYKKSTHLLFSLESLTNLARNGRTSPAIAKIAGVLGIRVVGKASDEGTLQQLHKCRGEQKALKTLAELMLSMGYKGGKLRIAHCFNPVAAESLKDAMLARFPDADVQLEQTTGLCSFYAEEGGLMIGFEDENAK